MAMVDARRLPGVISGMIVWAVWFVTVYALTGVGCKAGWNQILLPVGGNLLSALMVISAVVALGLIGWCGRIGYAAWRKAGKGEAPRGQDAIQRQRFMAMAMVLLSVLAAIGTLFAILPMVMLDPCAI